MNASERDLHLIKRALGDAHDSADAFCELLGHYRSMIIGTSLSYVNDIDDADDVCQDVMINAYLSLASFDGRSSFRTWLLSITRNAAIDRYNKVKKHRDLQSKLKQNGYDSESSSLPTAPFDLDKILQAAEPIHRDVISLRYLHGCSLSQVAERFDLGLSAAKMRIHRAKAALKSQVESCAS